MDQQTINDYHVLLNYFSYVSEEFCESVDDTFENTNEVWDFINNAKRDLLTEEGNAFESELHEDINYINEEYKKFKRRLYYLKQKEKLQQDKEKLDLLSKSNLLCDDVILYKIAPFLNNFFKV